MAGSGGASWGHGYSSGRGLRRGFLYSLYDALVSISVPSDKARAVVDAMERDMGTTLATKQDLENSRLATKQDLELLRRDMENGLEILRKEMESGFEIQRREMESGFASVEQRLDRLRSDMSRDMAALDLKMTVKLGSLVALGFGMTVAALRLWT